MFRVRSRLRRAPIAAVAGAASAAEAPYVLHDPVQTYAGSGQVTLVWQRPTLRMDGSAIGVISSFKVYEDEILIATLGDVSTTTQTGRAAGAHRYTVTCTASGAPESYASYGVDLTVT